MLIAPRDRFDDRLFQLRLDAVLAEIGGRRLPVQLQEPTGFRCSRRYLLECHLEEPVELAVPEWDPADWEGLERDRQRFLEKLPSGHDLTRIALTEDEVTDDVTLMMSWCVGGRLDREGPVFEHAVGAVKLSDVQRDRLLWWKHPEPRRVRFPPIT